MNMSEMREHPSQNDGDHLGLLVAAWLATQNPRLAPDPVSMSLLTAVVRSGQMNVLLDAWQRLGAFGSLRAFGRLKGFFFQQGMPEARPMMMTHQGEVWWHDATLEAPVLLGTETWLFQQASPQEVQVQIAYDAFRYRFLTWLERHSSLIALEDGNATLMFLPAGNVFPDLPVAWQRFVAEAFSSSELQQTFILLVNSITLSDRGMSVPDIPLVTMEQVEVFVAFLAAALQGIARRLRSMERKRRTLQHLSEESANPRELTTKEKATLKDLDERLAKQHDRYDPALARFEQVLLYLQRTDPVRAARLQALVKTYSMKGIGQLKQTRDVMNKAVTRIEELLALTPQQLFQPPLLLVQTAPMETMRMAGDFLQKVCYTCGCSIPLPQRGIKRVTYTANKLILPAPSQTLQSRLGQVEPYVCPMCALLSIASPIKLAKDGLVIALREWHGQGSVHYLYGQQLRMLTTGELNIAAGRYLLLPCTEKAPDDELLLQRLGGKEYALLKVASLFPRDVLTHFQVEAFFGVDPIVLPRRHLLLLRFFIEIFAIQITAFRDPTSRPRYMALAEAIRSLEHDHLVFALYQLVVGFQQQATFSTVQRTLLEDGLAAYKECLAMDGNMQLEQRFRDIAGLTGVLYAFVSLAKSRLEKPPAGGNGTPALEPSQRDRELKKLLEEVDNPNHFTYEAASSLSGQMAQLWRSQQSYFIYDEAKRLLQEIAGVDVNEREARSEQGEPILRLYYDDICKLYAVLYERHYLTEAAQRAFTYELKLSLYSRFPELRPSKQNA